MKKGFTLIELLGVIIILSVIIVLTMPNIINTIKKSNANTSNMMGDIIFDATRKYIDRNDKYKSSKGNTYCITVKELVNDGLLETPVKYGDDENIEDTKTVKATYNNRWNYSIVNNAECISETNFVCTRTTASGSTQVTTGYVPQNQYHIGDEYICKVNNSDSYHFFILSVNGNTVNLIADRNLQNNGKLVNAATNAAGWSSSNDNTTGPISAYSYLEDNTEGWTNIPVIKNFNFVDKNKDTTYGYRAINIEFNGEDYVTKIYTKGDSSSSYTNMRARLPMYNELVTAGCTESNNSCPAWLTGYISADKDVGYWLLDSGENQANNSYITTYGTNKLTTINSANNTVGIRPVIELNKNNLE